MATLQASLPARVPDGNSSPMRQAASRAVDESLSFVGLIDVLRSIKKKTQIRKNANKKKPTKKKLKKTKVPVNRPS